jgi:hypothetical protein
MKSTVSAIEKKMEPNLEKMEATNMEANPEEMQFGAGHREVPKEHCQRTEGAAWGPESIRRVPSKAKGMDPGKLWIPEKISCRSEKDDPPYRSGMDMAGTTLPEKSLRMDIWEEMSARTRKHHGNKDPRLKEATSSEKREDILENLRENHWAGDCKRTARSSIGLYEMRDWALWKGWPPPKQKRDCTQSRSQKCGSTNHSGKFYP